MHVLLVLFAACLVTCLPAADIARWDFETDPGWTIGTGWEIGTPVGTGFPGSDPASAYGGAKVAGYNLATITYPNSMTTAAVLVSPTFSTVGLADATLTFRRWLTVESSSYDRAGIEWSQDGTTWTPLWSNASSVGSIIDTSWSLQTLALPNASLGQAQVRLRWTMGPTDTSINYGGWTIDDVVITGTTGTPGLASQTVTISPVADRAWSATPFTVTATSDSGLPVTVAVTSGPATISGNQVTLTAPGTVTLQASQAGNASYSPASASTSFTVSKASQTITFPYPGSALPATLTATASSGLPVRYSTTGVFVVTGSVLSSSGAGEGSITAYQDGDDRYEAALPRGFTATATGPSSPAGATGGDKGGGGCGVGGGLACLLAMCLLLHRRR